MPRKSFSTEIPELQIAWDSTSIGALKWCPRYYYYNIVCGRVPREESVHLTFGILYHEALETYDKAKALGASHTVAQRAAVRNALTKSWNSAKQRPWISDHKQKNRETLIRTVVWYLEQFAEDPLETVILANGKPAVELSFRLEIDRKSSLTGEPNMLCGHIDRLVKDFRASDSSRILDHKTTTSFLAPDFFEKYSPDNQFSCYSYSGQIVFSMPILGVIASVAQVGVNFSRFQRGFVPRTKDQLAEWRQDLDYWLSTAEYFAREGYWPQNDKACGMFGGCPYRKVCGKSAASRKDWLEAGFSTRFWDPLITREA